MLSNMAYVYTVCVTIYSTSSTFRPVPNFTELHTLIQVTRSYALLTCVVASLTAEALYPSYSASDVQ